MKQIILNILTFAFLLITPLSFSQIDKNSILTLVQGTTAEINAISNPVLGSLIYNSEENKVYKYTGASWGDISTSGNTFTSTDGSISINQTGNNFDFSAPSAPSNIWSIIGNSNTNNTHFLGTTNDVKLELRSNNFPFLQLGRRQTLGLTQGFPDYNNNDQPLIHINGDGNTAAIQFAASAASFYKPMFFTTTNGSFRLKGSSGITDFFEMGSSGPNNDGSLEFIIGDDGLEPIIFKRYDYRSGGSYKELFRVQASENSANAKTRFGININPGSLPLDPELDDGQAGFNVANSTLQINGSFSMSIISTATDITLTEEHFTVICTDDLVLSLPPANSCLGRLYILKNVHDQDIDISPNFLNNKGDSKDKIKKERITYLQSDGTNWQQIN